MESYGNEVAVVAATFKGKVVLQSSPVVRCSIDLKTGMTQVWTADGRQEAVHMSGQLTQLSATQHPPARSYQPSALSPAQHTLLSLGSRADHKLRTACATVHTANGPESGFWLHPAAADCALHGACALEDSAAEGLRAPAGIGCYHVQSAMQGKPSQCLKLNSTWTLVL